MTGWIGSRCWAVAGVRLHPVPTGAGYSVLLLLHVAAALVGFGALAVTGYQAARARRGPSQAGADGVRRYFRPGVNWPGRALYAVPVLGFALIADSNGAFSSGDGFVVAGLVLWLAATLTAEGVVWPAERRIQIVVTEDWGDPGAAPMLLRDCQRVVVTSLGLLVVFLVAVVIMFGKP